MKNIKNYLLTGMLVWLPIGLTIWIIDFLVTFLDALLPHRLSTQKLIGIHIPGIGIIICFVVILLTGIIAKNVFGQKLFQLWDKIIFRIPIVKSIYKGIKQVSDTLLSSKGNAFRKAILVRFPHNEVWTIAFITGSNNLIDNENEYINVYVPTTPNPTSGYLMIVKKSDTKEINMTVEQALRYVISMGAVDPRL